jgi:hypothetical protein
MTAERDSGLAGGQQYGWLHLCGAPLQGRGRASTVQLTLPDAGTST